MRRLLLALLFAFLPSLVMAQEDSADRRLILVTMDGTRWQEVFRGPDPVLLADKAFTQPDWRDAADKAWMADADCGAALMPFLHGLAAAGGVLTGNRDRGECMAVANPMWFSYPGYNEMLTGRPDPAITSNDKVPNRNVTFLEWLARRPGYVGKVVAVGNWDVFPYIINAQRSGLAVNGAFGGRYPTETLAMRAALDALREQKPRVLYVGLGDTDEFAHEGSYDQYLFAMNRDDDFIAELWRAAQADPAYRGRTTLIVTTDHGRGAGTDASWTEHGSAAAVALDPAGFSYVRKDGYPGSDAIWLAAIGPGVRPAASAAGTCLTQGQVAASALAALGEDWKAFDPAAAPPLPFFATPR